MLSTGSKAVESVGRRLTIPAEFYRAGYRPRPHMEIPVGHWRRNLAQSPPVLFKIKAAKVFKVVGVGAQSADDGIGVPTGFVFDALAVDGTLA